MTILIITLIYLTGSALSFFRYLASMYQIEEEFIPYLKCSYKNNWEFIDSLSIFLAITSWIGLLAGTIIYFIAKDKYYLKFNFKDLNK